MTIGTGSNNDPTNVQHVRLGKLSPQQPRPTIAGKQTYNDTSTAQGKAADSVKKGKHKQTRAIKASLWCSEGQQPTLPPCSPSKRHRAWSKVVSIGLFQFSYTHSKHNLTVSEVLSATLTLPLTFNLPDMNAFCPLSLPSASCAKTSDCQPRIPPITHRRSGSSSRLKSARR